jgi:hypothetical protein
MLSVPGRGFRISRCGTPTLQVARIFTVTALAPFGRRSLLSTPLVRPQRLLTSCAHRLRKPHRTIRPLTPSVAERVLNEALHARSSSPFGSPRDVNHAGIPALPGAGLAIVGLAPQRYRYQDAFRWFDLRPRDRSKLTRAPFDVCSRSPRTLSPTANRPPSSPVDRRVKLTLARSTDLSARFTRPGRCVYPTSATDLQHEHSLDRSVLESPPPSAFADDDSFHAVRPAETLAASMIEWSFA